MRDLRSRQSGAAERLCTRTASWPDAHAEVMVTNHAAGVIERSGDERPAGTFVTAHRSLARTKREFDKHEIRLSRRALSGAAAFSFIPGGVSMTELTLAMSPVAVASAFDSAGLAFDHPDPHAFVLPFGKGSQRFSIAVILRESGVDLFTDRLFEVRSERELACVCALNYHNVVFGRFGVDPTDGNLRLDGELAAHWPSELIEAVRCTSTEAFFAIDVLARVRYAAMPYTQAAAETLDDWARQAAFASIEGVACEAWQRWGEPGGADP